MDRLTLKASEPVTQIEQIAATSYTVQPTDRNAVLGFISNAPITVTLPPTLPQGFAVELLQMGTGQITAQGPNLVSPQGAFTTAVQYGALACLVLSNPSGTAGTWRVTSAGGGGAGGGSTAAVTSYAAIRGTAFPPTANLLTLSDPNLGGAFVPGATGQRDDGGTCIHDATGKPWSRLIESRINAAWFYSRPGGHLGDGTAAAITATDVINNPQWVGLPDGSGMYPPGTYWDYIALQEWIYACAAQRSSPPAVFQGSIASAILTVSAWISGPHSLTIGQPISGPNIATGTAVCYDYGDGVRYGVGIPQGTGSLGTDPGQGGVPCLAEPSGCQFHCYITNPQGALLVVNQVYSGALQIGDEITAPPGGVAPFGVILPGTYILAVTTGPGAVGNYVVGVCANDVPSQQMNVVGGAIWNKQGGSYQQNRAGWCPNGYMDTNQKLACCAVGLDLVFEHRSSAVIRWHGNMGAQQLAAPWNPAGPAVLFNAISYSGVDNLCVSDSSTGCTGWLVSNDYDPNQLPFVTGLAPQANTFRDWFIGGAGPKTYGAVALAKAGGAAQTDTQVFINLFALSALNGVLVGGDNAIGILFVGGNFTSCPGRGIYNSGEGCFSSVNTLFEANPFNYYAYPQVNQITMDGADIFSAEVGTENSYVVGTRSESIVACIDITSGTELHAYTMAQAAGFGGYPAAGYATPAHQHLGYSLVVTGNNFSLVMAVDDSGPDWQLGQLDAATQTVITFTTPFTGAISGGVLTVDAMGQYGGQLNIGDVISGPGVPGGVTVSGFAYGTGGQAGTYTLAGAAGVNVADGTALTAQPNWPVNAWANWPVAMRFGSNGTTQWSAIVSSTANTATLAGKAGSWPTYPTAFKIQSQTGTAPINWAGVPVANFGRSPSALRPSPGYLWGVKQGSNWIICPLPAPPVGAYAVATAAQRFMLQQPQGPGDIGALIGKVGAVNTGGAFNGSILYSTLTVTTTPTHPLMPGQSVSAAPGTRVTGQTNGPVGGAGTYAVDSPQIYPTSAQFGGSITGNVLTVTNGFQGQAPHAGDYLIGQNGTVPANTQLLALLSGVAGQTGSTWQLSNAPNSGYDWMYTGSGTATVAMSSGTAFSLVHPYDGKPVVAGITSTVVNGYWGQPIWDGGPGGAGGGIAWIPIDFDAMWGVKQFRGGQIPLGRATRMGPMDSEDLPSSILSPSSSFVRDTAASAHRRLLPTGPGPAIAPANQALNANPFTVPVGNNAFGVGGTKSMFFTVSVSATLNLPQLPTNLELDLDIAFSQGTATPYTITWGTSATGGNAPIRAPTPTLLLGGIGQITSVRLKWLGNVGAVGSWLVTSIQGPM